MEDPLLVDDDNNNAAVVTADGNSTTQSRERKGNHKGLSRSLATGQLTRRTEKEAEFEAAGWRLAPCNGMLVCEQLPLIN